MPLSATVIWTGVSYSGGKSREHSYDMSFAAAPHVGERIKICGKCYRVIDIEHKSGHMVVYTTEGGGK